MTLTILTPTYNRKNYLPKLYDSLRNQTCYDFTWLIIDDGSTDGTDELCSQWTSNCQFFKISYYKKPNGGKQTALNYAYQYIDTKLTFIVDSDDWLTEDAVSTILTYDKKYSQVPNLCGYSFWRLFPDGRVNGKEFAQNELRCTFFESRILTNDGSDKAEVWYTNILRNNPFPEYPNEKCYPEDGLWLKLSGPYDMIHINKGIYIGDYLEGGLTDMTISKRIHNWPKGMVDRSKVYLEYNQNGRHCTPKTLIKHSLLYVLYGLFGAKYKMKQLYKDCPRKGLFILCLIPGLLLGLWYSK